MGISGYLNGINPFNQPGVRAYKTNMCLDCLVSQDMKKLVRITS